MQLDKFHRLSGIANDIGHVIDDFSLSETETESLMAAYATFTTLACNVMKVGKLTSEEENHLRNRDIIPCIKSVRERTGMGLKEAKEYVEAWGEKHGLRNAGRWHWLS